VHAQGIREQPRRLLAGIPGLTLVPLAEADGCCGSAGSYSLLQPEMAARLLARKMRHLAASGADVVASGNPGCLWQLRLGVARVGLRVRVAHPVELLAEAYG
jgi:glycolate oxidase iron-sulfur subunit